MSTSLALPHRRPALLAALLLATSGACSSTPRPPGAPLPTAGEPQAGKPLPGVAARTAGLQDVPGLVPFHWDAEAGKLYLEPPLERLLLHVVSLPAGLGSNDVGLDRGQLGPQRVVRLRRAGRRVLLVAENLRWRSSSADEVERRAVAESFATSVLAAFEVVAEDPDGRVLVDATGFFLEDAHGIARTLEDTGQGSFRLASERSVLLPDSLRGFPENSEVEALLTFTSDRPGGEVRSTAAEATSPSLRVRHSFVALPPLAEPEGAGGGFRPRRFDPRSGFSPLVWTDLSAPLDAPLREELVTRHRLDAEHPIVYYVDRAAPEPIRTALLEGARYWEPVFAAAGHPGGFRAELLPHDVDPHDVRINVIQWVHRSTRGWSYGSTVTDPRTGQILKGHVTLGALRVRRDIQLLEGLLSPWSDDPPRRDPRVLETALARIRQLSAHEVGHTLGLAHNFAASADGRTSVMDYPPPRIGLAADGGLDLSEAYAPGCGAWDEVAIRYGYGAFEDEEAGPPAVLAEAHARGLHYLTDADARGTDRSHPLANLWDDGTDPVAELETTYEVRRRGLARLSEAAVRPEQPLADLERVLVPTYLHHRYQLEACVRAVGGRDYAYDVRGEGAATPVVPVPGAAQRRALALALRSLEPSFLALEPRLLQALPPPPPGHPRDRESFRTASPSLSVFEAADASIALTLDLLLDPARLARLVDQELAEEDQLGLEELLASLDEATFASDEEPGAGTLRAEVRGLLLERLIELAEDAGVADRVRAGVFRHLQGLRPRLETSTVGTDLPWLRERLRRFLEGPPNESPRARPTRVPPGPPIGASPLGECGFAPGASSGP